MTSGPYMGSIFRVGGLGVGLERERSAKDREICDNDICLRHFSRKKKNEIFKSERRTNEETTEIRERLQRFEREGERGVRDKRKREKPILSEPSDFRSLIPFPFGSKDDPQQKHRTRRRRTKRRGILRR